MGTVCHRVGIVCRRAAEGEGAADVGGLGRQGEADLRAGAARAAEDVRAELRSQDIRQLARDHLRLVVAAPPLPRPMQRHRHDDIDVGKLRRGSQALTQHPREVSPGRQTALVLQVPGNAAKVGPGIIEKESRGERIWLVPAGRGRAKREWKRRF